MNNGWSRVTTESLVSKNKDAIWTSGDRSNNVYKEIRIKFACSGSVVGFVYPVAIVVSNLSKEELPNNQWIVIPIKGLSINGHIDPRNEEVGYVRCMGTNLLYKYFFEWFNETITYPTIQTIQKKFNPLTTEETQEGSIHSDQDVCMLYEN